jgi:Putative S-adenosyl-L-methionine-dependent methyltransferase
MLSSSSPQSVEANDNSSNTAPVHTVVLALEVLDNLPHDKVRIRNQRKGRVEWEQAEVENRHHDDGGSGTGTCVQPSIQSFEGTSSGSLREVYRPLHDPLLRQILNVSPSYPSSTRGPVWIPSVACGVVLALARELQQSQTQHNVPIFRSRHRSLSLLVADFDWLPPPDRFDPRVGGGSTASSYVPGVGEPLVTCMNGYDHRCYLDAPVLSDVLFPTDFGRLASFCQSALETANFQCRASVSKQSDFLRQYDDAVTSEIDRTKSWLTGYSPLLDDFANCSVLTVNVACTTEKVADSGP